MCRIKPGVYQEPHLIVTLDPCMQVLGGHDIDVAALEKEFGSMDMEGSAAAHDKDRRILLEEVSQRREIKRCEWPVTPVPYLTQSPT